MLSKKLYLFYIALLFIPQYYLYADCTATYTQFAAGSIIGETDNDLAGSSVALSATGTTGAILAEGETGWNNNSGRVRIFKYTGGSWSGLGEIDGQHTGDYAGSSVALSTDGTVLAEGELGWSGSSGRVRTFEYTGGSWSGLGEIDGQNNYDYAGYSVALSANGSVLAEGEWGWSGNSGRVRIFQYTGGSWSGLGEIDGQNNNDFAGSSIALSADGIILAEGEYGWNEHGGRIRIFQYTGGSWSGLGEIDGESKGDLAGLSVALSADGIILASGEPGAFPCSDCYNTSTKGRIRIFKYTNGSWNLIAAINGESHGDYAGWSVALSADGIILASGEPGAFDHTGRVRIFQYKKISKLPFLSPIMNYVFLTTPIENNMAGSSIALSADGIIFAGGQTGYNNNAGQVRTFQSSCDISKIFPFFSSSPKNVGGKLIISEKLNLALTTHSPEFYTVERNGYIKS